jgi:hypothetical protein
VNSFRRLVIFVHRYLGIPMSLVFVVWFVSGIVMIYAGGMPVLSADERLAGLEGIEFDQLRHSPADAALAAGLDSPRSIKLRTVLGRPAYRFGGFGGDTTVFADTGELLEPVDSELARGVAAQFTGRAASEFSFVQTLTEPDQWTLAELGNLPLHEFALRSGDGTHVYVSANAAEVVLVTDTRSRMLAWAGTIPHWFYFTPLRSNQPIWYWTVVWLSAIGCLLAVLGLILGVTQFRRSQPFSLAKSIRYRGLMRWHYLSGALFGLFALTWVFSGLLSMEPFAWTKSSGLRISRDALSGGPIEAASYPFADADKWRGLLNERMAKEIEFVRIQDETYYIVEVAGHGSDAARERLHQPYSLDVPSLRERLLVHAATMVVRSELFPVAGLLERMTAAADAPVTRYDLLTEYDNYYYSQRGEASLPILRIEFADPAATWYYVDPRLGRIVGEVHRNSRLERWLFNGLHSLDFSFWYSKRPLWDIGVILLSLGALATSLIGMYLGLRRLLAAPVN